MKYDSPKISTYTKLRYICVRPHSLHAFVIPHTAPLSLYLYTMTHMTHDIPRMVTGLCLLPVSLVPTWSSTRVLLDTVHVPSPVMLATPFVYTLTPTVTLADSVHVIEKV